MGWFRNQRTAVGKTYKSKSGQAPEKLTQRKAWHLNAFAFLREHITPRSYTVESTVLPSATRSTSRASNEDSDNDCTPVSTCAAQSESSSSAVASKSSAQPKKKARRLDDALLDYLSRPRPSDNIADQLDHLTSPQDERAAFGQWLLSRIANVPGKSWEQFQRAAFDLVLTWTRPPSSALQQQSQQHCQSYPLPYQPQTHGCRQGYSPGFQQSQPQGFTQQFPHVQLQMPPRAQITQPVPQSSPQLSESRFTSVFLQAMQSPEDVERADARENVAKEGDDGGDVSKYCRSVAVLAQLFFSFSVFLFVYTNVICYKVCYC